MQADGIFRKFRVHLIEAEMDEVVALKEAGEVDGLENEVAEAEMVEVEDEVEADGTVSQVIY